MQAAAAADIVLPPCVFPISCVYLAPVGSARRLCPLTLPAAIPLQSRHACSTARHAVAMLCKPELSHAWPLPCPPAPVTPPNHCRCGRARHHHALQVIVSFTCQQPIYVVLAQARGRHRAAG